MITATETEQSQAAKMDREQVNNTIHGYFEEKMTKKKGGKRRPRQATKHGLNDNITAPVLVSRLY
jgi:hypothetical protein